METKNGIETRGVTKFYGTVRRIEDLGLEVRRGEILGFLGPKGSGKTATMKGWGEVGGAGPWSTTAPPRVEGFRPRQPSRDRFSASASRRCRSAVVRSPRVRSSTPRIASVLRRRPRVTASGKSMVTSSV